MEGSRLAIIDLPLPGGADHNKVMSSCGSYFQGTLYAFLPADVCVVEVKMTLVLIKFFPGVNDGWFNVLLPV
jgi:hypothetical protein